MYEINAQVYITLEKVMKTLQNNIKKILEESGLDELTSVEINTLMVIGEQARTMKEIISDMVVSSSTPTRVVDNLVAKKLVTRFEDTDDRRKVIVKLTESGMQLYNQINDKRNEQVEIAFSTLSKEEKEKFLATISIVINNIRNEG